MWNCARGADGTESADGGTECGSQDGSGLFGAPTGKDEKGIGEESCFVDSLRLFFAGACRSHLEWVDTGRRIHMAMHSGLSVRTEGSPGH